MCFQLHKLDFHIWKVEPSNSYKESCFVSPDSKTNTIQSTLSKLDTFGAGTKCPSKRDGRLIESQIKGIKRGRDQL